MLSKKVMNEKGFVLAEFVIALPLLILLTYSFVFMVLNARDFRSTQAADYILEEEAHEILDRITKDARAAKKISLTTSDDRMNLEIKFHATSKETQREIPDIIDSRFYILYAKKYNFTEEGQEEIKHVYVHRQLVTTPTSPLSGENSSADTTVEELKFTVREKKILHISLKLKSLKTKRIFSVNTSVFMPDCEEVEGF